MPQTWRTGTFNWGRTEGAETDATCPQAEKTTGLKDEQIHFTIEDTFHIKVGDELTIGSRKLNTPNFKI